MTKTKCSHPGMSQQDDGTYKCLYCGKILKVTSKA